MQTASVLMRKSEGLDQALVQGFLRSVVLNLNREQTRNARAALHKEQNQNLFDAQKHLHILVYFFLKYFQHELLLVYFFCEYLFQFDHHVNLYLKIFLDLML